MSKKKIAEIVGAIVLTILVMAALGWFYYGIKESQKTSAGTSEGSSLGLIEIPLNELESAEFGSIITVKNLKKFGEIPVVVSGSERTKSNPFLVDDPNNQTTPSYNTNKFSISYPSDWSKIINKTKTIEFRSPLEEGISYASVTTNYQSLSSPIQGHDEINAALKLYGALKIGIGTKDMEKYVEETTNKATSSYGGRINYSYKLGDQIRKGWIFGISFATPSQELTNNIYKLIQENKNKSKYLTSVAGDINDSITSSANSATRDEIINGKISKLLQEKNLIEELNYLGQNIVYNTPPFQGILILNYETDLDHFDKFAENAKTVTQQITFTETVTLPSAPTNPSETTTTESEQPPTTSE